MLTLKTKALLEMSNNTLNLILSSNRPELFINLLKKDDIDYKEVLNYLLINSFTKVAKDASIVRSIYNSIKFDIKEKLSLLETASKRGLIELVKLLLLKLENKRGFIETVNEAFQLASWNGHIEVVRLLLADPRVDPSANNNSAIQFTSRNGHTSTVRLLLADPRVDPSDDDSWAIQLASQEGRSEVVKLLLADPRVDPSALDNFAIRVASELGHTKVVKFLSLHIRQLDIEILAIIVKAWLVF